MLKRVSVTTKVSNLTKPVSAAVLDGNTDEVSQALEEMITKNGTNNALVFIIPVSEQMPSETFSRKQRDSGEEKLAGYRFVQHKETLPFALDDSEFPTKVRISLFRAADEDEAEADDDDETANAAE